MIIYHFESEEPGNILHKSNEKVIIKCQLDRIAELEDELAENKEKRLEIVKKLNRRNIELQEKNKRIAELEEKVKELESELTTKENLFKIKNAIGGKHETMSFQELRYDEISESYTFEELVKKCVEYEKEIAELREIKDYAEHLSLCLLGAINGSLENEKREVE